MDNSPGMIPGPPHKTAKDFIKCDVCRKSILTALSEEGWLLPKPEMKEVVKIVEVVKEIAAPASKIETTTTKHLGYEIKPRHLT